MKKQYDEMDRPIIEAEFLYVNRIVFGIRFVNYGKHTAQKVRIDLSEDFLESIKDFEMYYYIESQKGRECVIGVNQHYDLFFGSYNKYMQKKVKIPATGVVTYEYNSKRYKNDFCFDFENYMTIFSTDKYEDDLLNTLKNYNKQLEGLKKEVKALRINNQKEN